MTARPLPRDLRRALELLEGSPARKWEMRELAAACGTAQRTLQKHFRSFLGSSALEYLRGLRLQRVRRDLLSAGLDANVTRIATRHGFQHLGRFSGCYRDRYGELPSDTLRRRRAGAVAIRAPLVVMPVRRPPLAVLPFESCDAEARGLRSLEQTVAATLCRLRSCSLTAPERARYHVRGSVHGEDSGVLRTTVFLVDVRSGRRLWADQWIDATRQTSDATEEAAERIASALQRALRGAEMDRAGDANPDELGTWELCMRALPHALSFDAALEMRALDLLDRAMELSPSDALPAALASWCHGLLAGHHLSPRPSQHRRAAASLAARASPLAASDPLAEIFLAGGYTLAHDLASAAIHAERALALDSSSAWAWGRSAWVKLYRGETAEALERFRIARDLGAADQLGFLWAIGIGSARMEQGDYAGAIEWYERALAERPSATWNDRFGAAAYALGGRKEEARRALARFGRAFPGLTIADVRGGLPYSRRFLDQVSEGLESAGMRP